MAGSIDKTSIRKQLDDLKASFEQQVQSATVSNDTIFLFNSLFALIDIILAVFMERKTKKNSRNSSIPPSQTEPDKSSSLDDSRSSSAKKRTLNKGTFSNQTARVSQRTIKVDFCSHCGEDLSEQPANAVERRTKIDIVFQTVTTHIDVETKHCPSCGMSNKGRFPAEFQGPSQYGKGLKAYLLNLMVVQMVALNRVQQMAFALVDRMISEATMLKYIMQLHNALARWENEAIETTIQQKVIHTDETSFKVNRKKHWIHVYSAGDTVLKFLHPKRGKDAIKDIDIIPNFFGVIVHDCWASYLSYEHCLHGLCGSHLLRELAFIIESNQYRWASNMKRLLKHTCQVVSQRESKQLTSKEYQKLQKHYRSILTRGEKEMPPIPDKPDGQRGKVAKSDAHNLLERLRKHESAVLLFANMAEVPFTNNRAERDLRMSKVKQKVSGCFRSVHYAKAYCRISSYIQTMTAKGYNPMAAIEMAFSGEIYNTSV